MFILGQAPKGGMRIGEVLKFTPSDIQERTLAIQNPKSGRAEETVFVPRKLLITDSVIFRELCLFAHCPVVVVGAPLAVYDVTRELCGFYGQDFLS